MDAAALTAEITEIADHTDFSGVVSVTRGGSAQLRYARGLADRANERTIRTDTAFGIASASKGFTAVTVASLIESDLLALNTPFRDLVPDALPDVDTAVTIEHLLGHSSGVGDYLDEEQLGDTDDEVMPVPIQRLVGPGDYLPMLSGRPQRTPPGSEFRYNNSGYVMLSLAIEAATGSEFVDVVDERVFRPAGMVHAGFHRSDRLPANTALGYLRAGRTNAFHLPVRGAGDGGAYASLDDVDAFWSALFAGRLVSIPMVDMLTRTHHVAPVQSMECGLGFWRRLASNHSVLEGMDAGVSFRTIHDPTAHLTATVISNTSDGAWPIARSLDTWFDASN